MAFRFWASIDPGVTYLAVASWDDTVLSTTKIIPLYGTDSYYRSDWLTVVETPHIYVKRKARAKDIEGVLRAYGRLEERLGGSLVPMDPHMVPEKIWHARILSKLSPAELAIAQAQPKKVQKHTLDAIGLGLKHLGRL